MHNIQVADKAIPLDQFTASIDVMQGVAETHATLYSDLSEASDETFRAWQAAMVLSGNAVVGLAPVVVCFAGVAESAAAAGQAQPVLAALYAGNREFYGHFSDMRYGEQVPLPADLAARKAALPAAFAALKGDYEAALARAKAMTESPAKTEALAMAQIVETVIAGADDSVRMSQGTFSIPVSDSDIVAGVRFLTAKYQSEGMTLEQAQAKVAEELGATDDERRVKLSQMTMATYGLDRPGTADGATLCAEKEIAAAVDGVNRLLTMVG